MERRPNETITVAELAAYLKVSRGTVCGWVKDRKMPAFKVGSYWHFSVPVVVDWLKEKEKSGNGSERPD